MKYPLLFFIALVIGCSKEESSKIECRLSHIAVKSSNVITQTLYTYNASGKMLTQVRTRNGTTEFSYTYSYRTDGKVDKVTELASYSQYEYASDGKLAAVTAHSTGGPVISKITYTWSGEKVEARFTKPQIPNPIQVTEREFLKDNMIRTTVRIYNGAEPNVLLEFNESRFEDFDTALSPFYIAAPTRPGFGPGISKNNPGKQINTTISYKDGIPTAESSSTTFFSYTYNSSNVAIASIAMTGGIPVETDITYDNCK